MVIGPRGQTALFLKGWWVGHYMLTRRVVALTLFGLLILPLCAPVAAEWEEDSWLTVIIGPERLELGDEFGCHGMAGSEITVYELEISECRDYLTERINSSKWAVNPISLGIDSDRLDEIDSGAIIAAGFAVVDQQILPLSSEIRNISYNGGSLEKNMQTVEDFQELIDEEVPLINFYWKARDHDVVVRPNSELVSSIESTTAWFTTWGEHASYQATKSNFMLNNSSSDSWLVTFESDPFSTTGVYWDVPITNQFSNINADVVSVNTGDIALDELVIDSPHLQTGWRQENNSLILTLMPGQQVTINFDSSTNPDATQQTCERFNCHPVAITVAGFHTNDLFDWSRRWDDTPMRFTWLVEPREVAQYGWILPTLAVIVALCAPVAIIWLVKNDRRAQQVVAVLDNLDNLKFEEE
ncbi:MAG: hypothetical protein CXX81_00030 [Methanobacteriota archaeon]|nr:MAG: hypothetical protein CXX81_00030 [Euryarchaeota archaeon]HIA25449.1 hypothetical protein [Candidatus Poseidoniales archaeon]